MPPIDAELMLPVAHRMADAARAAILPLFRSDALSTENKNLAAFDPVTAADKAAEQAMRAILAEDRPDDGILGEEFGTKTGQSGLTWVLDPIDGTRAFVCGTPTWGVLIACGPETGPTLGIIDQPYLDERFVGLVGHGAWLERAGERQTLQPSTCTDLAEARILTTFPEVGRAEEAAAFHRLASTCKLTRYGLDCYAYALLAMGQVDLVVEAGLQAYDIQGPLALIQAAGGCVTAWDGGPAHMGGTALAAATPELHQAAMDILNG